MMKRNQIIWTIAILAIFAAGIGYYVTQQPFGEQSQSDSIRIGVILNLTGPLSTADVPKKLVLESSLDYLKENTPEDDPIQSVELLFEDGRTEPNAGISAYNKLYNEGVRFFLTGTSFNAMSLLPLVEEKDGLLMAVSGHPDFSGQNTIRLYPNVETGSSRMISILDSLGTQDIYILHTNEPFGRSYAEEVENKFEGDVVGTEEFEISQLNFRNTISKIESANPERIIVIGFGIAEQNLIKQLIESKIEIPILGSEVFYYAFNNLQDDVDLSQYPGISETVFLAPKYIANLLSPEGNPFIRFYKNNHNGNDPQIFGVFAADGLSIIHAALQEGSNITPQLVMETIQNRDNISTFSGEVRISPTGETEYPLITLSFDQEGNILFNSKNEGN